MAKLLGMSTSTPGLEIWIEYNTGNRRVQSVQWTVPSTGQVIRARVWNGGQLVFDRTVAGPASGAETVAGNIQLVEVTDAVGTYLMLPPSITYEFNVESIG